MRARIKFTSDLNEDLLVGTLKSNKWWPHFDQNSSEAQALIGEVRDSVEEGDVSLFEGSTKYVLSHTNTESRGTLSEEHGVWVVRLLNPSIHLLQLACETLVLQVVEFATANRRRVAFEGPIQIVERKRKETIIEGRALATAKDRKAFANTHRKIERLIFRVGLVALAILLLVTFPWHWRNPNSAVQIWAFSIFEKFIGSVAVTTLISYLAYRSFLAALREHTIQWAIPGPPEKLDVRPHSA